jgi:D-alanine-D-alanine ligase
MPSPEPLSSKGEPEAKKDASQLACDLRSSAPRLLARPRMKIAFSHNYKRSDSEEEAEFDAPSTVEAILAALSAGGHEVIPLDVSGPIPGVLARLQALAPDLIFNTAEGRRGPAREALYPALFDELGLPYTGSDARVLMITLDKWLTKLVVAREGVATPKARLITGSPRAVKIDEHLPLPAIVKPNYEGSSKGIDDNAVVFDAGALYDVIVERLKRYPEGVLVEAFIPGVDITVPYVAGLGENGVLSPAEYVIDPSVRSRHNLYDYRLKNMPSIWDGLSLRCPAILPESTIASLRTATKLAASALGIRDVARFDFRLGDDGSLWFLEANGLPSLDPETNLVRAAELEGLSYNGLIQHIARNAAARHEHSNGGGRGASHSPAFPGELIVIQDS